MSEIFSRISIEHLCSWILREEAEDQIFGIHRKLFFVPSPKEPFSMNRFGKLLETPIGVAAGPHTQMAQNIITAWLCGARYIELKTVQTLDRLNVSKPCIDAADEGYNCEWSQELCLDDSFDEYLNAWIILHVLRHKFGWNNEGSAGFIFNMSVGYNMEGILKPNVQKFFDRMNNCRRELDEKIRAVAKIYPQIAQIDIPSRLSDNITLSTMHGCPPDEIEKIGMYLITQRKLHTTIKLNPTLLGPDALRHILNKRLGFSSWVPDEAFEHDLKYPDAVKIVENLREAAWKNNVHFALKLTNTLECVNFKNVFPPNEKMMYMSGRALHPISINVAARLQNQFNGDLDISFSAGADCFNLSTLIACGLKPVTVSSDILKPGGYGRFKQYLDELRCSMEADKAHSINEFIKTWDGRKGVNSQLAALTSLRQYAGIAPGLPAYRKDSHIGDSVKVSRPLPPFDCIGAPCINTCPGHQDIPSYLYYTGIGEYAKAFEVILRTNPFPHTLGMVCDHQCQHKCTRTNYDDPLLIREIKRFLAERNQHPTPIKTAAANGKKVAIIGAGPSGLACAYFLALDGFSVTIFETKAFPGGMVADAIPSFRLKIEKINKDIDFIRSFGVKIIHDSKIDKERFAVLKRDFDFIYVAVGAQASKRMGIPGETNRGVMDGLSFLSDVGKGKNIDLGTRVAIIGGGNSAMDAARTAFRMIGSDGKVTVIYRRSRKEMPAETEEIKALLDEGIEILELTAPIEVRAENGKVTGLKCKKMRLKEKGADGRAAFEPIPGSEFELPFDTVIPSIGQDVVIDFMTRDDLKVDAVTGMTRIDGVFAGGDAVRGPATVIKAVGDGRRAATNIAVRAGVALTQLPGGPKKGLSAAQFQERSALRIHGIPLPEIESSKRRNFNTVVLPLTEDQARIEAKRCLYCNDVCNVCVTVCPNRANRSYLVTPGDFTIYRALRENANWSLKPENTFRLSQDIQVLNLGDFCNECGNCQTFCPTSGAPYKDKPKFYLTENSFLNEKNGYYLTGNCLQSRINGNSETLTELDGSYWYQTEGIKTRLNSKSLSVEMIEGKGPADCSNILLDRPVYLGIFYRALKSASFVI